MGLFSLPAAPTLKVSASLTIYSDTTALPQQLDYSSTGRMSQDSKVTGFCKSSWAIAASYLYESSLLAQYYTNFTSEQALLSCTTYYAPNRRVSDCSGGYF